MPVTLIIHITAGALAIILGYIALFAAKGGATHRKSGLLFVYAMVVMGTTATMVAAARGIESSVLGGVIASYMVVTALTTVRQRTAGSVRLDIGLMLVGATMGAATIMMGFEALANPGNMTDGVPAGMLFFTGGVALLASASDLRAKRSGGLRGARRLARHLWRMCYALFIAAGSFFLGQADEFPEEIRIFPLLAMPILIVFGMMFYWLWRLRFKRLLPALMKMNPVLERT